ncbi:MAG TPA: hypothetical protein VF819_09570 [Nitrospira sp.]
MTRFRPYVTAFVLWGLWTIPLSFSGPGQNQNAPSPPPSFEADLLRIDGDRYLVKDTAGVERQIHVGRDTEVFDHVQAGDRIQLWVQPDGHAQAIIIVMSGIHNE